MRASLREEKPLGEMKVSDAKIQQHRPTMILWRKV